MEIKIIISTTFVQRNIYWKYFSDFISMAELIKTTTTLLQSNFTEITLRHAWSLVNLLHISKHLFLRTPLEDCFCKPRAKASVICFFRFTCYWQYKSTIFTFTSERGYSSNIYLPFRHPLQILLLLKVH